MRTLITLVTATLLVGCHDSFCAEYFADQPCPGAGGEGGDAGGSAGGAGGEGVGGTGGEGGMPPAECLPVEDQPIAADCGVFVMPTATGNGSQTSPYGSIATAVAGLGNASRIYVCGGDTYPGSIVIDGGVSIYGGFDCSAWIYRDANPTSEIRGDADAPALTIPGDGSSTIQHIRVTAPPAVAASASSIAILSNQAALNIVQVEAVAGAGAPGAPGGPGGAGVIGDALGSLEAGGYLVAAPAPDAGATTTSDREVHSMTQAPEPESDHGTDETIEPALDEERVAARAARPTTEEQRAGSDDPEAQAEAILADSEQRIIEQAEDPEGSGERRTSDEATEPL